MNHALDGARLKIARAQEHLDCLQPEVVGWLNEQPNVVRSQPDHRGRLRGYGTDSHMLREPRMESPPLKLSAIIGDCLTNARAALDHTVWQLAVGHFNRPLKVSDRKWVSWPIYATMTTESFVSKTNGFAKQGIPMEAIAEIKRAHHENPGHQSLWWLNELVNEDKHRLPLLTVCDFDEVAITLGTPPWFPDTLGTPTPLKVARRRDADSVVMQSNVPMQAEFPFYVAFKDVAMPRMPVQRALEQIVETVAGIIPRFDQFF